MTAEGWRGPRTFDPDRTEGGGTPETARNLRTALLLGWRVESNWTDPVLFFIYTVARPIASLLLLVAMVTIIGGTANDQVRTFVILGSALWAMLVAGLAGPAWSVLEDRERYRMLKYLYVSPATFLVLLVGRGGARLAAGAMGTAVALVFAVIILGLRIDLLAVSWPLFAVCLVLGIVPILALGVLLAAVCLQTRQESWSYPDAFAGALFLISGVVFPLSTLPRRAPGHRPHEPHHVVGRGRPARARARRPVVDRRPGLGVDSCHRFCRARRNHHRDRLVCDWGAGYTRGHRDLPIQRTSGTGSRVAGPNDRLVASRPSGGARRRSGECSMRIYDGSPRQDFEEVFRSIGAFLDSRGMRDILVVEVPDGFVVQGLVAGTGRPAPGRRPSGRSRRRR